MSRWVLNRVGLLNFWYYQNQIFQFADGKMLLRGTNGSGKSLTMQSLFPVLFDGDTSAYRLDSFGSRDRKMEDYLLGEKGVSTRDDGIGYLFLEVKRQKSEEYLTIGIGMHANRGAQLNKWFFAIENNQRIGFDFELFEELRKDEFTPLTKQKLKNRLDGVGQIFENQRAYKHYVKQHIFGFETLEQFDELIALLMNLRSPKLSKDFRPTVIYGILRDSLPKLQEDELLTLSKTIERLDGHHERVEDLSNELRDLGNVARGYQRWHEELTGQLSTKWLDLVKEKEGVVNDCKRLTQEITALETDLITKNQMSDDNEVQLEALEMSIQDLSQHEGMNLVLYGQQLQEELGKVQTRLNKAQVVLQEKQQQIQIQQANLTTEETSLEDMRQDLEELLIDNEQYQQYLGFEELDQQFAGKLRTEMKPEEFSYWKNEIDKKQSYFESVIQLLRIMSNLQEKVKEYQQELGDIQQRLDGQEKDLRQWQQIRIAEVTHWKHAIDEWRQQVSFSVSEQAYGAIMYQMELLLEESIREEEILRPIHQSYQAAINQNQLAVERLAQEKSKTKQQIAEKQSEIKEWQQQKTPEIEQRATRQANRLKNQMQLSANFYKSVDFLPNLSEEIKNNLEGALYASGILDSLISAEGLVLADDQQILPAPQYLTSTLADYLDVDQGMEASLKPLMMDILQSILVDDVNEVSPTIFSDGSYKISNLNGQMPEAYQASYIGFISQERYRKQKIIDLQAEIADLEDQVEQLELKIEAKQTEKTAMDHMYRQVPTGREVYEAIDRMHTVQLTIKTITDEKVRKEAQVQQISVQVYEKNQELLYLTKYDNLKLSVTVYEEALHYAKNYKENVRDVYVIYEKIQDKTRLIVQIQDYVTTYRKDADEYSHEINDLLREEILKQRSIQENLEQQSILDVQELQKRLAENKQEQWERKQSSKQLRQQIQEIIGIVSERKTQYKITEKQLVQVTYQEEKWQELFKHEAPVVSEEQTLQQLAKEYRRELNLEKIRKYAQDTTQRFQFVRDQLQNYNPQLVLSVGIELSNEEEQQLGDFSNYNHYSVPRFTIDGQKQTVFELVDTLEQQKLILQDLLSKEDEQLFKTIILESVGNILRSRIAQSAQWVDQMNQILKAQKNSSGLSLSIRWKPLSSLSEKDLGTKKLVALLEKEPQLLSESDKEAISRHFQEKVYYAQAQVKENEDDRNTLFQAIAKVLDYRDWFEFELKFKRGNDGYQAQVLSDKRFNQFSGGEKAIAMYLPLFAAVNSRYKAAGAFCPKVITLDEAFAGIDDANISELFKACEQLEFNYIMNSQALFGDYATVSSLMIYELLRPQNINLVTTIQYYWDGHQRQAILE